MAAGMIYNVVTEFKFEIGHALMGSKALTEQVQSLSSAADHALGSFQRLSVGLVAQLGLGPTSIMGLFGSAINSSERFKQTQLAMANVISANMDALSGPINTFNDRLAVSERIMKNIGVQAAEFGLSGKDLMEMTKGMAAMLIPKGLAGNDFKTAIDMSRNLMKSAPNLQLNPHDVQGQLIRAVEGGASMGDTLFRRLVSETHAMSGLRGGKATQLFNAMPAEKRVDMLNKALGQFASDTDVLTGRVQTLTGQFQRLKALLSGDEYITNIFRPLGDVLNKFVVSSLSRINDIIEKFGSSIVQNLANMLGRSLKNPEKLFVDAFQLKSFDRDYKSAADVISFGAIASGIGHGLKFLGVTSRFASPWVGVLAGSMRLFYDVWDRTPDIVGKITKVAFGIAALLAVLVLFPPLAGVMAVAAALTALFQLFSRAEGIAAVEDAKVMPGLLADLAQQLDIFHNTLSNIMGPFMDIFDGLAEFISPIFRVSEWVQFLNESLWKLSYTLSVISAAFTALGETVATFMHYITSGDMLTNPMGLFTAMGDRFSRTFEQVMSDNLLNLKGPDGAVQNQITNIGKVEIKNEFKDQMEPDRIAFTLRDQLMKAANNPRGTNQQMRPGLAGGTF